MAVFQERESELLAFSKAGALTGVATLAKAAASTRDLVGIAQKLIR